MTTAAETLLQDERTQGDDKAMLRAALELVCQGYHVMPLEGKIPIGALVPNGSKDATTDAQVVLQWWLRRPQANVGIATGHELPGGGYLTVIDVDGDEGRETFMGLQESLGVLPETIVVTTGGGGSHFYLRAPAPMKNSQARKAGWVKVDIRGQGGYVVAPPSVHESGQAYEWLGDGDDPQAADLPPKWLDAMTTTTLTARVSTPGEEKLVPHGERHDDGLRYVGWCHKQGYTREATFLGLRGIADGGWEDGKAVPDANLWKMVDARDGWPDEPLPTISDASDHLRNLDALLKKDPGAAMSEATINAFITAMESDPVEAERTRATLRKHRVSLKTFDTMVKKRRQFLREQAGLGAMPDFEGAPIKLEMPEGWAVKTMGVYYSGDDGPEQVIPVPLYLTRRVITIGDSEERVEITWERDGQWHEILEKRSVVFGARSITTLADRGLPVTSENASRVVRFLAALEAANRDALPLEECCTQAGWIGSARFYPGAEGAVDFEPPFESDVSDKSFNPHGDYDEWKAVMLPLIDKYPLLRVHMASSFAAPLLKLLGHRNFVVHLWGPSGGGKSAALTAAMSVWGSPRALVANFNATAVGIEQRMALMNGLPVALNERQVANKAVDKMIYMAGESKGRTRGAKEGGLRKTASWQMILLTNGEEPLVSEYSREGERTRVLEYAGRVLDDEADAGVVYDLCDANFGWAGRDYIQRIMAEMAGADFKALHDEWKVALDHEDRVVTHTSSLAVLALADQLMREWVFGYTRDKATAQAYEWATRMVKMGHSRSQQNEPSRAYELVVDSVRRYLTKFERPGGLNAVIHPEGFDNWGFIEDGKVHFIVSAFNDLVRSEELSPLAVKRGLDGLGFMETEPDGHGNKNYFRRIKRGKYVVVKLPSEVWAAIRGINTGLSDSGPTGPTELSGFSD